jgi:hypothetical protein
MFSISTKKQTFFKTVNSMNQSNKLSYYVMHQNSRLI